VGVQEYFFGRVPPLFLAQKVHFRPSPFGERFRDSQYSLVSFLFAIPLLTVPPCPAICKSGGTCPPALWFVPYGVGATLHTYHLFVYLNSVWMTLTKYGIVKSIIFPICLVKKLRLSGEPASRVVFLRSLYTLWRIWTNWTFNYSCFDVQMTVSFIPKSSPSASFWCKCHQKKI